MTAHPLLRAARARAGLVVRLRRGLHRIPELAFQERETTRYVARFLAGRGIPFEPSPSGTGGVAVVGRGEPVTLLRADLDALPVAEEGDHPYRSRRAGRMHACGHDAHAAMLLAAADALASGEVPLRGRVACVFQPAEEGAGGCARLLAEGLLERHPASAAAALHVWPGLPAGAVGLRPGPLMAGMDRVRMRLLGRGGHGAYPHRCIDPVVMAAHAVVALQTLVSRSADPLESSLLTVGSVHGGTAPNVIPDRVDLDGTIRYYAPRARAALLAGIERIGSGVAAAHGGRFEWAVDEGYPVTVSDPECTRRLAAGLGEVLGAGAVREAERSMGSEDMALVLARVPGCYVQLGCAADPATAEPLHSPRFTIDEACLPVGVAVLLAAATGLTP